MDSLLSGLADLNKAGDQGIASIGTACIFTHQELIAVQDPYDHGRRDPWIDHVLAGGTLQHTLKMVRHHFMTTLAAELVYTVPVKKVMRRDAGEGIVAGNGSTEDAHILISVTGQGDRFLGIGQEIPVFINRKQIKEGAGKGRQLLLYRIAQMIPFVADKHSVFVKNKDKVIVGRNELFIFIVIDLWINVLYHKWITSFFIWKPGSFYDNMELFYGQWKLERKQNHEVDEIQNKNHYRSRRCYCQHVI